MTPQRPLDMYPFICHKFYNTSHNAWFYVPVWCFVWISAPASIPHISNVCFNLFELWHMTETVVVNLCDMNFSFAGQSHRFDVAWEATGQHICCRGKDQISQRLNCRLSCSDKTTRENYGHSFPPWFIVPPVWLLMSGQFWLDLTS
jgi:hypothetical protein